MRTADLFKKKTVISFEIFPPKATTGEDTIYETIRELSGLAPDFISVTYGASGGDNCGKTIEIASAVKNQYKTESVAHLPGINLTKEDVRSILAGMRKNNIENLLALRGDVSAQDTPRGEFHHADELIAFIRENGDFNILAACYPEGHPQSRDLSEDIFYLKKKVDAGANHLITQLFLDNDCFYSFRERAVHTGINLPIEAGIMPVTNKSQIEKMVRLCGVRMPAKIIQMIEKYNDPDSLLEAGISYAIRQIEDLISSGVDGIHLYTMNKPYIARKIHDSVCKSNM